MTTASCKGIWKMSYLFYATIFPAINFYRRKSKQIWVRKWGAASHIHHRVHFLKHTLAFGNNPTKSKFCFFKKKKKYLSFYSTTHTKHKSPIDSWASGSMIPLCPYREPLWGRLSPKSPMLEWDPPPVLAASSHGAVPSPETTILDNLSLCSIWFLSSTRCNNAHLCSAHKQPPIWSPLST